MLVSPSPVDLRPCSPFASLPSRSSLEKPCPQPATIGPQEESLHTEGARDRLGVLGFDSSDLVWLDAVPHPGEHGDHRSVAPRSRPNHLSLTNCTVSAKTGSRQSICGLGFQALHANRHRSRFASTNQASNCLISLPDAISANDRANLNG